MSLLKSQLESTGVWDAEFPEGCGCSHQLTFHLLLEDGRRRLDAMSRERCCRPASPLFDEIMRGEPLLGHPFAAPVFEARRQMWAGRAEEERLYFESREYKLRYENVEKVVDFLSCVHYDIRFEARADGFVAKGRPHHLDSFDREMQTFIPQVDRLPAGN